MRQILSCLFSVVLFGCTSATSAQNVIQQVAENPAAVIYPYNPDEDASGLVGAGDLLPFLISYGNPAGFYVSDTDMDPMVLQNVLGQLASEVLAQQQEIETLQDELSQTQEVLAALLPLLSLAPVAERTSFDNQTWTLEGLNLQVVNGEGSSYGSSNGLGNLILGYNEEEGGHHEPNGNLAAGEIRSGSHNLILGAGHTFASNGAFVGGYNNTSLSDGASLLSGQASLAIGTWSAVLGGLDNRAMAPLSCISGGHSNTASGERSSVSGGLLNESAGVATSILGGQYMQVFEQYETASGQYDINN